MVLRKKIKRTLWVWRNEPTMRTPIPVTIAESEYEKDRALCDQPMSSAIGVMNTPKPIMVPEATVVTMKQAARITQP
jgi:hypothetical protein